MKCVCLSYLKQKLQQQAASCGKGAKKWNEPPPSRMLIFKRAICCWNSGLGYYGQHRQMNEALALGYALMIIVPGELDWEVVCASDVAMLC